MKIESSELLGAWWHAHEEDDENLVLRPDGYPLGLSRGRKKYQFSGDGTLQVTGPDPTDRMVSSTGAWHLQGNILNLQSEFGVENWLILDYAPQKLVMRRL